MPLAKHRAALERLYFRYTRPDCIHPDPLEFVHQYRHRADREIVGLLASSLAYGRVAQILRSVRRVLDALGPRPSEFLMDCSDGALHGRLLAFRHRFTTGPEVSNMLLAARRLIERQGSLGRAFLAGMSGTDETVVPALGRFVDELTASGANAGHLLPSPRQGSACKRLNLFLRWMVRRDAVDCGLWGGVGAARLIVPLDTHMYRLGRALGAIRRRSPDLQAALELTAAFRAISPWDPVRYDFALTRLGIRPDKDAGAKEFLSACAGEEAGHG